MLENAVLNIFWIVASLFTRDITRDARWWCIQALVSWMQEPLQLAYLPPDAVERLERLSLSNPQHQH